MILGAYWGNTLELEEHLENKVKLDGNTLRTTKIQHPFTFPSKGKKLSPLSARLFISLQIITNFDVYFLFFIIFGLD
jgi:hypothetical protein